MTDHDHTSADGCSWGRCTRCGGWIWQAMGVRYSVRQDPGYPHEVVAGPWSGAGACQCPPAATSPEPAGEADEIARLRAERDRLRDAGNRLTEAGILAVDTALEHWPDEYSPPDVVLDKAHAWDAAADAWMAEREVKP